LSSTSPTVLAEKVMCWKRGAGGGGRNVLKVEPALVSVSRGAMKNTASRPVLSQTINWFWAQSTKTVKATLPTVNSIDTNG